MFKGFSFYACSSPCDQQHGYIKVAKNPQTFKKESQMFFNFAKLWVPQLCEFMIITYKF